MSSLEPGEQEGHKSGKFPVKSKHTAVSNTYDSVRSPPVPKRPVSISNKSGGYVIPARRFAHQEDPTAHYLNVARAPRVRNWDRRGVASTPKETTPSAKSRGRPGDKADAKSPRPQKRSEFDPPTTQGALQDNMPLSRIKFKLPAPGLRKPGNSTTETTALRTRSPIPTPRFHRERRPEPSSRQTQLNRYSEITVPFTPAVKHPTTGFPNDLASVHPVLNDILQQCRAAMERYAKQATDGSLIFTSDRFACGMFDHHGGYLPLPFHKVSLYVTPHAIVADDQVPIFVYVLPESAQEILVFEDGEKVISSTIVCGKTDHKFSSDVVLSFPLLTQSGCPDDSLDQQVIVWEYGLSMYDTPKQQVMDKTLDCFYCIEDNRCTLMVNQLANFTVISKAERRAEDFRSHHPSPHLDESVSLRVGVFGRQIAGTVSAQIRVIFWKDCDLETNRILSEEQRDGFSKLDLIRVIVINKYRKTLWVAVVNVIPGWSLLSKDRESFTVENILLQHRRNGRFPSCTFALYRSGADNTPHVAACTIEVSQDGEDEDGENECDTIQLVALVEEGASTMQPAVSTPDATSFPPRRHSEDSVVLPGLQEEPSPGKGCRTPTKSFPVTPIAKPPACLRYKTLGELALHLQVSNISGLCWKLLARNMGLSAPDICCLSERYLCPGEALINWYLGQQVAIVTPREALRRLLDLFREMKWSELQTIMVKELRFTENQNQGLTSSTHLKTNKVNDNDNPGQSPGKSVTHKVKVHTPHKGLNPGDNCNKVLLQGKSVIPKPRPSNLQAVRGHKDKEKQTGGTGPTEVQGDDLDRLSSERDAGFENKRSEKTMNATRKQKVLSDKMETQFPSKLLIPMQNVTPSVKESTVEELKQSKSHEVPAVVVTGVTSKQIPLDEEDPYLQPERKKVQRLTHLRQPSKSVRLKKDCVLTDLPIPPKRSTSFKIKTEKEASRKPQNIALGDTSLHHSDSLSKSLTGEMSTDKQSEHDKTYNKSEGQMSLITIPLLQLRQDYRADSDLEDNCLHEATQEVTHQDASSFQTRLKNLHKVVKRNYTKKNEDLPERPPRQDSLTLDDSTNEAIYDNIDGCSNQLSELTVAEASGERQYGERLKQLSKDLLAKITPSTASKKPPIVPSKFKLSVESEAVDADEKAVGFADRDAGTRSNLSSATPCSRDDMIRYEDIDDSSIHRAGTGPAKFPSNTSSSQGCPVTDDMECYEDIRLSQKQFAPTADHSKMVLTKVLPKLPCQILPCVPANDMECYENASIPEQSAYRIGTDRFKPVPKVKKIPCIPPRLSPNAVLDDMVSYEDVSIPVYPLGTSGDKFKPASKMTTAPQIPTRKNTDYHMLTDDMVTYEDVTTSDHPHAATINELKLVTNKDFPKVAKKPHTTQRIVTEEMTTYEDVTEPECHVATGTDHRPVHKRQLPTIPQDNPPSTITQIMVDFNTPQPTSRIEYLTSAPKSHSPKIPPRYHDKPQAATDDMVNYEDVSIPVHLNGKTKNQQLPVIPPRDQKRPVPEYHTSTRTDHLKPSPMRHSPVLPPRDHASFPAATDDMVSYEDVTMPEHRIQSAKDFKSASKMKAPVLPPRENAKPPDATYDTVPSDISTPEYPIEARINQSKASSGERVLPAPPTDYTHGRSHAFGDEMQGYEDMNNVRGPARTRSDLHSKPQVTADNMPSYEDMAVPQYPAETASNNQIKVVRTSTGKLMPVRVFVPKQN